MRYAVLVAMTSLFCCASAEAAFVCPVKSVGTNATQDQAIAAAIPAGNALDDVTKLNAAVTALQAKGVSNAVLVDSLISSYCPTVAGNAALNVRRCLRNWKRWSRGRGWKGRWLPGAGVNFSRVNREPTRLPSRPARVVFM